MSIPEVLNIEKFASYKELIIILYRIDSEFRSICDDYTISKMCIEKYQEKLAQDIKVKNEYENLFLELEQEILTYIKRNS